MEKKRLLIAVLILITVLICASALFLQKFYDGSSVVPTQTPSQSPTPTPSQSFTPSPTQTILPSSSPTPTASHSTPVFYTYEKVHSYPHDITAFTQGLVIESDDIYLESTGSHSSESTLRRVVLSNGTVLLQKNITNYFAEGIAIVDDKIIQLTWQDHTILVYNRTSFDLLNNYSLSTEGWGITYNGTCLILSDGTSNLYFLNSETLQLIGQIAVRDGSKEVANLNELEYINGDVYANIWQTDKIAIINPQTGQVKAYLDLAGLYQSSNTEGVLNGIAYNPNTNQLFVTGKYWPNIYEITIK